MPRKKPEFDDMFPDDLDDDALAIFDDTPDIPTRSMPERRHPSTSQEIIHQATERPDDNRPMQGNYQRLSLVLDAAVEANLKKYARRNGFDFAPFMRWVIDWIACALDKGLKPGKEPKAPNKKPVASLLAPAMVDMLRGEAKRHHMRFQPFMRWAISAFMDAYNRGERPDLPDEFIPGEAALYHWASQTVTKGEGTGVSKRHRE